MRKLHKKYIFLNVFLIIYIMSLSVGYAYFSESIKATGTAKTLSYYTEPLKVGDLENVDTSNPKIGADSMIMCAATYKSETHSHPYYYMYYDVPATSTASNCSIYLYFYNYAKDINITDFTATYYDNSSVTSKWGDNDYAEYYTEDDGGGGTDADGTDYYGFGMIQFLRTLKAGSFSSVGTRRQVYIKVSYKSQGATKTMYFYYYFDIV